MTYILPTLYKKYSENLVRSWTVGANVQSGTLVVDGNSTPGVTLTPSGGTAGPTYTLPDGSTWTKGSIAGIGNATNAAPVAVDGSWLFKVTGATAGATVGSGAAGTARGTKVYRVSADGSLTLTATGNTYVGVIDDCTIASDTTAAVKIGL